MEYLALTIAANHIGDCRMHGIRFGGSILQAENADSVGFSTPPWGPRTLRPVRAPANYCFQLPSGSLSDSGELASGVKPVCFLQFRAFAMVRPGDRTVAGIRFGSDLDSEPWSQLAKLDSWGWG